MLLALILGLPAVLIVLTAHRWSYVAWMLIYLISLPIWNFVLPTYAYWKFDDFTWGDTRKTAGETKKGGHEDDGEFDSSKITMKRWQDFEHGTYGPRTARTRADSWMNRTKAQRVECGLVAAERRMGGGWFASAAARIRSVL